MFSSLIFFLDIKICRSDSLIIDSKLVFEKSIKQHGGKVVSKFGANVTHVLFKDGDYKTLEKVRDSCYNFDMVEPVIVDPLWLDSCLKENKVVPISGFEVAIDNESFLKAKAKSLGKIPSNKSPSISASKLLNSTKRVALKSPTDPIFSSTQTMLAQSELKNESKESDVKDFSHKFVNISNDSPVFRSIQSPSKITYGKRVYQIAKSEAEFDELRHSITKAKLPDNLKYKSISSSDRKEPLKENASITEIFKDSYNSPRKKSKSGDMSIDCVILNPNASFSKPVHIVDYKQHQTEEKTESPTLIPIKTPKVIRKIQYPKEKVFPSFPYEGLSCFALAISGLRGDALNGAVAINDALGSSFVVVNGIDEIATHVIIPNGSEGRTVKVLHGLARGSWILPEKYLQDSMNAMKWLDESFYDDTFFAAAAKKSRDCHCKGKGILSGISIALGETSMDSEHLASIVQAADGSVTSLSKCTIIIGTFKSSKSNSKTKVTLEWLLDSLSNYQLQEFDKYLN